MLVLTGRAARPQRLRPCFLGSNLIISVRAIRLDKSIGPSSSVTEPSLRNVAISPSFHSSINKNRTATAETLKKRAAQLLLSQLQKDVLWEGTVIDEPQHHLMHHFVELSRNPKYRNAKGLMCVGGKMMIRELCQRGYHPDHLLIPYGAEKPQWADDTRSEIIRVSPALASSSFDGSDGYVGDFRIPDPPGKEELIANKQSLERVVVLDNVHDPGHVGTILRTAAGFQYDAIILTNHCAELYDHRVVRAARGAHFQKAVPIYSFKEEDGDDTNGMLNHIMRRNNLSPLLFSGKAQLCSTSPYPVEALPPEVQKARVQPAVPHERLNTRIEQRLSSFCFNHFSQKSKESGGLMLFISPNYKGNIRRQLSQRLSRPVTPLVLDYPMCDFLVASSVVLHALRPTGDWDYLPATRENEAGAEVSRPREQGSVEIGANRLEMSDEHFNLDESEQKALADETHQFRKWKRMRKRKLSDYDHWMEGEERRISSLAQKLEREATSPWNGRRSVRQQGSPSWVPNIIDEYRQPLDRDTLRVEQAAAGASVRPSNYDQ